MQKGYNNLIPKVCYPFADCYHLSTYFLSTIYLSVYPPVHILSSMLPICLNHLSSFSLQTISQSLRLIHLPIRLFFPHVHLCQVHYSSVHTYFLPCQLCNFSHLYPIIPLSHYTVLFQPLITTVCKISHKMSMYTTCLTYPNMSLGCTLIRHLIICYSHSLPDMQQSTLKSGQRFPGSSESTQTLSFVWFFCKIHLKRRTSRKIRNSMSCTVLEHIYILDHPLVLLSKALVPRYHSCSLKV